MPGAVREGFLEEATPELSLMSLTQIHLNVSEIVYKLLSLSLSHTHTHQILLLYNYPPLIHQSDPPNLFTNRPLLTIGKDV